MKVDQSFHNTYDSRVRPYQTYAVGKGWRDGHYVTLRDRSVEYEFFAHFHPYMVQLVQRLNDGGIPELQDSDTLYLPQPSDSQPLVVLPHSTRAVIASVTNATRDDGTPVSLTPGTPLTLPDGTYVQIAANTVVVNLDGTTAKVNPAATVTLPGSLPAAFSHGIQWTIAGSQVVVPDHTQVTLPALVKAVLTNDMSVINLPANTAVEIRHGLPEPVFYKDVFDATHYTPDTTVQLPYPVRNLDFNFDGAYSIYNWELFFHAPLLIAIHLSQNQRFRDAQHWFHYIFDPTDNSAGPTPERFWKVLPFQSTDVRMIEEILVNLSTIQDPKLYQQTVDSIGAWKKAPFQPFVVAKYRPTAYMLKTVMAYLDNLIAWGDSLFQQYTIETINEATQLYVLAANILGSKPQEVPHKGDVKPATYNDLRGHLDPFSNALRDLEVDIPFDIAPLPDNGASSPGTRIVAGIGQTLYFCVPRNDKLLQYWDTVAQRLFNIHNSLNLQGVFQALPLFDPPIDPALLVRAAASGLDVSAIVAGVNQPLPLVRFQILLSKATEITQEVQALGAGLLAAMEKHDSENLALLRAQHENTLLNAAQMVKYSQWQDAVKAREALEQTLANTTQRYVYYQQLLGRTPSQIQVPPIGALDTGGLSKFNFKSTEPSMTPDAITVSISQDATTVSDGEIKTLSVHEAEELQKLIDAHSKQSSASNNEGLAAMLGFIPDFSINLEPMGIGASTTLGGTYIAKFPQAAARGERAEADQSSYEGNKTGKLGTYSRRELEWLYQSNSAKGEINQIFKQLRGAQIREAIASKEYDNHLLQMQQAKEIVDFLQGSEINGEVYETTAGFHAWMKRETKALHAKAFQLAFEVAKKAERALQNEIGDPDLSFVQYNYLDGTQGLLAGEKLLFDLRRMDASYRELNQREYELTKHVSLLQVNPRALIELRATGTCTFTLPEELFDLDAPSHYFRRLKSVAMSIPCVTGPYTSLNCTLTLLNSSIRTKSTPGTRYSRRGQDDPRFNDHYGSVQAIVTSNGQNDSGLFETNLRDERYLPFELSGAISQWRIDLPGDVRQFDFDTITDVILHLRYTARDGGQPLKSAATKNLQDMINKAQTVGSVRLLSVRHEFSAEWARFRSVAIGGPTLTAGISLTLLPEHYPFWSQGIVGSAPVKAVELFAELLPGDNSTTVNVYDAADQSGQTDALTSDPSLGGLIAGRLDKIARPAAVTDATHPALALFFDDNSMEDLWVAITWGKA